jgi:MFS family permease
VTTDAAPLTLSERVSARLDATGRYPRAVLIVAISGLFATTFPVTVLTLAIPTIAEDFGVSQASLAWLVTLPILTSALALPVLGKLGDLHGHRRMFLGGFALATVATALSATATHPAVLIGWRTLAIVAGSSTMPSSLALINSVHRGPERARAMGWWAMTSAGAPVVGLTLGAPVIDALGWQMLFVMQAVLMVVPVVASWIVLRETPRREASFDVPGAVVLAAGVGPLLLGVDRAPEWGVTSPAVLGCVAAGLVGLVAFTAVERRAAAPLVPLAFFAHRDVRSSLTSGFLSGAAYMGGFFLASLLLVEQFGYTLTSSVPILAIRPALFALFSPVGGRVAGAAGSRTGVIAGCASLGLGMVGLAVGSAADSLPIVVGIGFVFQGVGYGLLRPGLTTALSDAVDDRDLGMAGAAERLTGQLGVAFGITVMATVYGGRIDGFPPAFWIAAVVAGLAVLAALPMRPGIGHGPVHVSRDGHVPRDGEGSEAPADEGEVLARTPDEGV